MILTEIQSYIFQHKKVSLADLELHFHIDGDALRGMLHRLVRKGRVQRIEGEKCGGCHSCAEDAIEFYEWVNAQK